MSDNLKTDSRTAKTPPGSLQRLVRPSSQEIFYWRMSLLRWCRLFQIRCFFGFCEFAVSCYGSKYILKAAFITAHLFERLELFRCLHKWWWFNDEQDWPNRCSGAVCGLSKSSSWAFISGFRPCQEGVIGFS